MSREWDLDGDDVVDSMNQHPSFVYSNPGTYTVSLTVINGDNTDTEIKESYITVFALNSPQITAIRVVSDDVIITWSPVSGAVSYSVYSSIFPYAGFSLDTTGMFDGESWHAPLSEDERFYFITASDGVYESDTSGTVGFKAYELP